MEWYDKEVEALELQLERGEITQAEFRQAMRELNRDADEQEYRQDMIGAGRGHLFR